MKRKSGFTLLELLITSALFVGLAASLGAIFTNTARLYFLNRHNQTVSMELQTSAQYIQEVIERAITVDSNYAPLMRTTEFRNNPDPVAYQCSSIGCSQANNILFLYTRKRLEDGTISRDPKENEWTALCIETGDSSRRQLTIYTIEGDNPATAGLENQLAPLSDLETIRDPYDDPNDADALGELSHQQNCGRTAVAYHYFPDIRPTVIFDDPSTGTDEDFAPAEISNPQRINQRAIDVQNLRFYPIYTDPAGTQPTGYQVEITAQPDVKNRVGIEVRQSDESTNSGNVTVRFSAYRLDPNFINRAP